MLALALLHPAHADDTFPIGRGPEVRSYAALLADGTIAGRTGRVLVRGDGARWGGPTPAAVRAAIADGRIARVTTLPGGLLRVEPAPGVDDLALARSLHGAPGVAWATPDLVVRLKPAYMPDDPYVDQEWHLENTGQGGRTEDVDIDASFAWDFATGAGQTIAIIDSGVQLDHPDLAVIPGHDYIDQDDDPSPSTDDSAPHGTGAAGIAAATGDNGYGVAGVAFGAEVYAIRLIGGDTTMEDLYAAFVEAVDSGASVLSNSWGFSNCSGVPDYSVFDDMFDYAEDVGRGGLGAAVAFAAGNDACDVDGDAMLRHRTAVVVAALEWYDQRAWYSSFGDAVDIAAPTGLLTTDMSPGGYGSYDGDDAFNDGFSGTSGATPVVAGVLALMFEANPRLTAKEARNVLCDTAVRVDLANAGYDDDGRSQYYGCGRIDAGAAVAAVADTEPDAPEPAFVAETEELPVVRLAWAPAADPDGDVLHYVVRWSIGDDAHEDEVQGTSLDIAGDVAAGDEVAWTVAAVDPWGEGPASEEVRFTVVDPPEPVRVEDPATCATGAGGGWMAAAAVLLLVRRRPPPVR